MGCCPLLWLDQQLMLLDLFVNCCGWNNSWCCWICLSTAVVGTTAGVVGSVVYCCGWNNSWCCWLCYQLLLLEQQLVVLTLLSTAVVETTADAVGSVVNCCGQKQQQFLAFYYIITQFTMQSLFSDY